MTPSSDIFHVVIFHKAISSRDCLYDFEESNGYRRCQSIYHGKWNEKNDESLKTASYENPFADAELNPEQILASCTKQRVEFGFEGSSAL